MRVPPPVDVADHNISPSLGKQLILELEIGVGGLELSDWFPCSIGGR